MNSSIMGSAKVVLGKIVSIENIRTGWLEVREC